MKKIIIVILPILFLGLLFGCSRTTESPPTNISLKTLLPKLDGYGFKTQESNELDKEDVLKLYGAVEKQFNMLGSIKAMGERIPVGMAIGKYEKGDRTISIKILKYRNKKIVAEEVNRQVEKSKEMQSMLQRGKSSLEWKLKQVIVSGHSAYYQIFGSGQKYETKLFWANGLYFFEVAFHGEGPWPEAKAIKIAEEIGY